MPCWHPPRIFTWRGAQRRPPSHGTDCWRGVSVHCRPITAAAGEQHPAPTTTPRTLHHQQRGNRGAHRVLRLNVPPLLFYLHPHHQQQNTTTPPSAAKPPTLYPPPCIRPLHPPPALPHHQHLAAGGAHRVSRPRRPIPLFSPPANPPPLQVSNFPTSQQVGKPTSWQVGKHLLPLPLHLCPHPVSAALYLRSPTPCTCSRFLQHLFPRR